MSVSPVIKNSCYTVGEGPHWEESTQSLLYVDLLCGEVHRWNSLTEEDTKLKLDEPVSFVIPRRAGGYVIGLKRKICQLDWNTAKTTTWAEVPKKGEDNRLNDGKCDPSGRLWLGEVYLLPGTMGSEPQPTKVERGMGALFSFDKDHNVRTQLEGIDISNGLAWSHDQRTMYYIDSIPRKVYAFDFDIQAGNISNQRVAVEYGKDTIPTDGFPDGMCIDNDGKLWVACFAGSQVKRFDPETGKEVQSVALPTQNITSCCFGGKNYDELYITCGRRGVSDEEFASTQPLAGSVFKVTGLGVKGSPAPVFEG